MPGRHKHSTTNTLHSFGGILFIFFLLVSIKQVTVAVLTAAGAPFGLRLRAAGALDVAKCRFDVADQV